MITRITGELVRVEEGAVVLDLANGLAYQVLVPSHLAADLAASIGRTLALETVELLEPVGGGTSFKPRLIGFRTAADRRFYELFTTVKGVGGRRALRAMAVPVSAIARAIEEDDAAALRALPEIGKRLAETIIAELSGKVDEHLGAEPAAGAIEPKPARDPDAPAEQAVEALVRLGRTRPDAERAVARAVEHRPGLATPDEILAAAFEAAP